MQTHKIIATIPITIGSAPRDPIDRPPPEYPDLWDRVQRLVYPNRWPSTYPPFPKAISGPAKFPASWLYHLLAEYPQLRDQVKP